MCIEHVCSEICFSTRNAHKFKIHCLSCDQPFNAKCFSITGMKILDEISSNSSSKNLVFLCSKCHGKVKKLKSTSRLSSSTVGRRSTAPSTERMSQPKLSTTEKNSPVTIPSSSTDVFTSKELDNLFENLNKIVDQKLSDNFAKFDASLVSIDSKLDAQYDKICSTIGGSSKHTPSANESTSTDYKSILDEVSVKLTNLFDNASSVNSKIAEIQQNLSDLNQIKKTNFRNGRKSLSTDKVRNTLDWNFSFDQTMDPRSSDSNIDDLYSLLDHFERNTWTSFDAVTSIIHDNNDRLISISDDVNAILVKTNINNSSNNITVNSFATDQAKEAMTQQNDNINTNVPETSKTKQKRQMPSLSGVGLGQCVDVEGSETNFEHLVTDDDQMDTDVSILSEILDDANTNQNVADHTEFFSNTMLEGEAIPTVPAIPTAPTDPTGLLNGTTSSTSFVSTNEKNEFHVSRFAPNTTAQMLVDFLRHKNVPNTDKIKVHRLVPKNKDVSALSYVSFKLDTDDQIAEVINRAHFWPSPCQIKQFIHKKPPNPINFFDLMLPQQTVK